MKYQFQICPYCKKECHPAALRIDREKPQRRDGIYGPVICGNCDEARRGRKLGNCPKCGLENVPLVKHHTKGRAKSKETEKICVNCHRKIHYFDQKL